MPTSNLTPKPRRGEVQYSLVRVQTFFQKIRSNLFKLLLALANAGNHFDETRIQVNERCGAGAVDDRSTFHYEVM